MELTVRAIFSWMGWTLIFAIIIAGRPWRFPEPRLQTVRNEVAASGSHPTAR